MIAKKRPFPFQMMTSFRVLACVLCLACLFLPHPSLAEEGEIGFRFIAVPDMIHPGKAVRMSFVSDGAGSVSIAVEAPDGTVHPISEGYQAIEGTNHITWDGIFRDGSVPAPGEYTLAMYMDGRTAEKTIRIGGEAVRILEAVFPSGLTAGDSADIIVECSRAGRLELQVSGDGTKWSTIADVRSSAGTNTIHWDGLISGSVPAGGRYALKVAGISEDGVEGTARQISFSLAAPPTPAPTPAPTPSPTPYIPSRADGTAEEALSYWSLPIGNLEDVQAIWEVMMQPITVINGPQKETYKLRATPTKTGGRANIVGEVTYASQGVHVIRDNGDGWTLIETYNSSYGPDCDSRPGYGNTDELITGYVETSLLKEITPSTEYALLIDKMDQKMYVFSQGEIIGTLLVSTGNPTKQQPWNETPAGEFLIVSWVGGFYAGNLYCDMALRVNGGCLIHEVPYIGDYDYSSTVPKLGSKASHGCIRVQKDKNAEGQNMRWLWLNLKINTKVLIWDDTGRLIPYPSDDTVVYYNPKGGKYFHEDRNCSSVKKTYLPLARTTYGALEELFETPLPCPYCCTIKSKAQIDALNESLK
ncbi:MAG: L,D-transpeptidase family protein [Clostridia bacterium]|nr:L,D-transpeptidase family protein [Clostridia bacterium]